MDITYHQPETLWKEMIYMNTDETFQLDKGLGGHHLTEKGEDNQIWK